MAGRCPSPLPMQRGRPLHHLAGREAEVVREVAETLYQLSSLPLVRCPTCFDTSSTPPMSLHDYTERLWKFMDCSIECFVIGVAYIQRILETHRQIRVGMLNAHTLAFSSLVVAAKFHEDIVRKNAYYARIGGVCVASLCELESNFLKLLGWRAQVTPDEFDRCCDLLFSEDRQSRLKAVCGVASPYPALSTADTEDKAEEQKAFYKLPAKDIASSSTVCTLADVEP
eukprot:TRINITY_DN14463_c0_g1_i1.p2 TRINITY_DN14463_c0_g1~~TRINITY_DN14463_c0_g1_i1.p2  ORF type:complete len:227 (-),score=43.74 TRINITY_DN14463_c0_g1_i1:38-718(-)